MVLFISQCAWPQNTFTLIHALQHSKATNRSQVYINFVGITRTLNTTMFISQVPSTLPFLFYLKISVFQILIFTF